MTKDIITINRESLLKLKKKISKIFYNAFNIECLVLFVLLGFVVRKIALDGYPEIAATGIILMFIILLILLIVEYYRKTEKKLDEIKKLIKDNIE